MYNSAGNHHHFSNAQFLIKTWCITIDMTKESDFDYREVESFVPSKTYKRALFTHSNLLFHVRGEGSFFLEGKVVGA
jgi:hypothetical protein